MALSPNEIAKKGEEIYSRKYRTAYERDHRGDFVVIEINSEVAFRAKAPEDAMREAQEEKPEGLFHLIKVGAPAAFHVSSFFAHP